MTRHLPPKSISEEAVLLHSKPTAAASRNNAILKSKCFVTNQALILMLFQREKKLAVIRTDSHAAYVCEVVEVSTEYLLDPTSTQAYLIIAVRCCGYRSDAPYR
jgi:hypothetical protein